MWWRIVLMANLFLAEIGTVREWRMRHVLLALLELGCGMSRLVSWVGMPFGLVGTPVIGG
jgi:hypothetical protein